MNRWNEITHFDPGELTTDRYVSYVTKTTITGVYAKEVEGAVLLAERILLAEPLTNSHPTFLSDRYFGKLSPTKGGRPKTCNT